MHSLRHKLLASVLAGGLTALAAWGVLQLRAPAERDTVELADNTESMTELLRRRARTGPTDPARDRLAPGDPGYPPPVVREPIRLRLARDRFYEALRRGKGARYRFQLDAHLWPIANLDLYRRFSEHPDGGWPVRTNQLGFSKDVEVQDPAPQLRVVVAGDSHTAGLVPNSESFPNVLETLLVRADPDRSCEVLNAGIGGTAFYNYLGVYEYTRELVAPRVLVVGVYGGNDFSGSMGLEHYYNRRPPPAFGPHGGRALSRVTRTGPVSQVLSQVAYFLDNPEHVAIARTTADSICAELARQCAAAGCDLVFVYIPPATSAQPERFLEAAAEPMATLGLEPRDLAITDRLGAEWMAFLAEQGLTCIDMTPIFRAAEEPCYWRTDWHVNTLGHRLIAEALAPVIARVAE